MIFNSRRTFLKNSFLMSVIFITCKGELFAVIMPLDTLSVLYGDIFPQNDSAPSPKDINAFAYINSILNHSHVTQKRKDFIHNGVKWLNEESVEKYTKIYTQLSPQQREDMLKEIVKSSWGESWLETLMSYQLEAMLGDPIYGGNRLKSGWKWLNHKTPMPRPTKAFV